MPKLIVFDIEIAKAIEECSNGWKSYDEMGISVLCAWEGPGAPMRFFDESMIDYCLAYLDSADILGGFNTLGFDLPVLRETAFRVLGRDADSLDVALDRIASKPHVDPLDLLIQSIFGTTCKEAREKWGGKQVFGGGKKLDDVAGATIRQRKSGDGASAPHLFQEGRIAELYDYCARDVWIEWQLVRFVMEYGYVLWGYNGEKVARLRLPEDP